MTLLLPSLLLPLRWRGGGFVVAVAVARSTRWRALCTVSGGFVVAVFGDFVVAVFVVAVVMPRCWLCCCRGGGAVAVGLCWPAVVYVPLTVDNPVVGVAGIILRIAMACSALRCCRGA